MIIQYAAEVTSTVDRMKQHTFGTAIVQKNTPGVYTYQFGQGKMSAEAIVNYMLTGAEQMSDMIAVVDEMAAILTNHATLKRIFSNTFPSLTQQLTKNSIIMTTSDNNANLMRAVGNDTAPGIIAALSEIIVEMFADTNFIADSIGYSFRELRTQRVPRYSDLVRLFMKSELIDVIESVPLRIPIKSTKFNPAYLLAEFTNKASTLGKAMSRIGYNLQHLHDALYVTRAYFVEQGSVAHKIPADLINSTEFGDLISNVTFVKAAFEAGISSPTTGAWNLMTAVRNTIRIINLSDRYSIVTLATAVAPYRYESITDGRSNLVGGVLSYAVNFKHPIEVGLFADVNTLENASEAVPLTDYNQTIGSMVAAVQDKDVMLPAHQAVTQMISALHIDSYDSEPMSRLAIVDTLSDIDMFHIAADRADTVFIDIDKGGVSAGGLIFAKDLRGKRLFAETIPFEGMVYTADPATLILSCDDFEPTIPFDMGTQMTPQSMWDTFMMDDDGELYHDFSGMRKFAITIGEEAIEEDLDICSLLRLVRRVNAKMIKLALSPQIFDAALSAPIDAYEHVIDSIHDEERETVNVTLQTQLGHILNGFLSTVYDTESVSSVVEEVVRRIARKVSPRNRDITYQRMHQINYRRQIDLNITFLILTKLGLLREPLGDDVISSTEARVMKFLRDTKFYERLIGTQLGKVS